MTDHQREDQIVKRLEATHKRVQWMADQEARAIWVGGVGARGEYLKEKESLLDETERLLDKLDGN